MSHKFLTVNWNFKFVRERVCASVEGLKDLRLWLEIGKRITSSPEGRGVLRLDDSLEGLGKEPLPSFQFSHISRKKDRDESVPFSSPQRPKFPSCSFRRRKPTSGRIVSLLEKKFLGERENVRFGI